MDRSLVVSIECDITEKAKHIIGENVIAKAVQHVATRHFKLDDEESVEETIKFLKTAASLYIVDELKLNEDHINLDPVGKLSRLQVVTLLISIVVNGDQSGV
ncbi:hypothetical protein DNHGIG_00470 [Collibacillus ludicampi]|uniref:Uncharacterized protein n=1 Tax=Collibacillus ludicampi TaxID=2771369 RepID=A0AAV4L9R5_9BACL|nr:hypothetical protein [Collibacillus ludicampi]GIM44498.1 hypothetical protein DNHGIG_00470 [Collibacillus ludicampi]